MQNSTAEAKRAMLDQLVAEHASLKVRLRELEKHISLTTQEKIEYARLKKLKLRTKDKIQLLSAIVSDEPKLTSELLQRFRQSGIRLDREGRFWHEGTEITHERLCRALLRWLDRTDDGRAVLRLDEERYAYLDVEDAHLLVVSARWQGDRAFVILNDSAEEELAYDSLCASEDDALYCSVRGGRLEARVTTPAYYTLAERILETEEGFALRAASGIFLIGRRERK